MREMTVWICFTMPSLGDVRHRNDPTGNLHFARSQQGAVKFLASWHRRNMHFAALLMGRHVGATDKILWDIRVVGQPERGESRWYRRYYKVGTNQRTSYSLHEAFQAGATVGINCTVPASISDDDFKQLMETAGRYRGLSPFAPFEYGLYEVVRLERRLPNTTGDEQAETQRAS